jgi:hypothetical protein
MQFGQDSFPKKLDENICERAQPKIDVQYEVKMLRRNGRTSLDERSW